MEISAEVLRVGAKRFDVDPARLRSLGGMDSAVFAGEDKLHGRFVIKFVPLDEPQLIVTREKWDFVNYLAEHGVSVARPLTSQSGQLVETVRDRSADVDHADAPDDRLYAVSMTKRAAGRHVDRRQPELFNETLFHTWGLVMGRMHALTQSYRGGGHIQGWLEEVQSIADWCPDEAVKEKWHEMESYLAGLPRPINAYGLIHNDLHPWNFLIQKDSLTVIDFDVCCHHWFATDIGIAIFHALWMGVAAEMGDRDAFARAFLTEFLRGYSTENSLPPSWIAELPTFVNYRRLLLFSVFSNEWAEPRPPWQVETLSRWRQGILEDVPVVKL